jgi:hypothetical protein
MTAGEIQSLQAEEKENLAFSGTKQFRDEPRILIAGIS